MQGADPPLTGAPAPAGSATAPSTAPGDAPARTPWWRVEPRYAALSVLVLVALGWFAWQRRWGGDFWLHNAVVAELVRHPLDPSHPLLPVDAPDHYFSPYSLLVALGARLFGLAPIDALSLAGIGNLALLLVGLWLFVTGISDRRLAPFWALLATLLLWGADPWGWSGYLNLHSLALTSPYPATFATGAALVGLGAAARIVGYRPPPLGARSGDGPAGGSGTAPRPVLRGWTWGWPVALGVTTWFVLLSHAFTAAWMLAGVAALAVGARAVDRRLVAVAVPVAGAAVLAVAWPLYPLLELLTSSGQFDSWQDALAEDLPARAWPALLGVPFLARRWRVDRRDPLTLLAAVLAVAVVIGLATDRFNLVRLDTALFLVAHIALGEGLADAERGRLVDKRVSVATLAVTGLVLCWSVIVNGSILRLVLPPPIGSPVEGPPAYENLVFAGSLPAGSVLMAPYPADLALPGFGDVKLVGTPWPAPFVDDAPERIADAERFYGADTPPAERRAILARWGTTDVLLPHGSDRTDRILADLDGLLVPVGDSPQWAVYRIEWPA